MALFSKKPDKPEAAPSAPQPSAPAARPAPPQPQAAAGNGASEEAMVLPASDGLLSLGEIVSLMLRSSHFRSLPLGAIASLIGPAFSGGQYVIARAKNEAGAQVPVAACLWASVSADVDRRLSENLDKPMQLAAAEWKSGDIPWVVAALGDRRAVEPMLRQLQKVTLKGRPLKLRLRGQDGQSAVRALTAEAPLDGVPN
jgi:hemolysin-activating ACP:hemolysin acyltransferase